MKNLKVLNQCRSLSNCWTNKTVFGKKNLGGLSTGRGRGRRGRDYTRGWTIGWWWGRRGWGDYPWGFTVPVHVVPYCRKFSLFEENREYLVTRKRKSRKMKWLGFLDKFSIITKIELSRIYRPFKITKLSCRVKISSSIVKPCISTSLNAHSRQYMSTARAFSCPFQIESIPAN